MSNKQVGKPLQTCQNRGKSYSQEVKEPEDRILIGVGNMGGNNVQIQKRI